MAAKRPKGPKRFRLSFEGPIEDQPRLIRAYGRVAGGEVALVMRPTEERAVLVHLTKKDGAFIWRSWDELQAEGQQLAKATVLRDGTTTLETTDCTRFEPANALPSSLQHGATVDVAFRPGAAQARFIGFGGDAPLPPTRTTSQREAVKLVKAEQKRIPKEGPTTLRGRWSGVLLWEDGKPVVELRRKLATYGTLTVRSGQEAGWSWSFERAAKWFTEGGVSQGDGLPTLSKSIEAGVLGSMSLVRQACGFRDTRRRAAHDDVYAERHPIRAPKPMRDPLERLEPKAPEPQAVGPFEDFARMPKKRTESPYAYARRLLSEATARVGEGHHHVVRELLEQVGKVALSLSASKAARIDEQVAHVERRLDESLTPSDWKPFAVGERVALGEVEGKVTKVPSATLGATDKVTFLAKGRKRGRRVEARKLRRLSAEEASSDNEKDEALIRLFSNAISTALRADTA